MSRVIVAAALFASFVVTPAFAQAPNAPETASGVAAAAPDGGAAPAEQAGGTPQLPRTSPVPETSTLRLVAGDFKHFFRYDTLKELSVVGVVAVAAAPWDRKADNNGFNIPTALFQSGNVIGGFAVQASAGFAAYGIGRAMHNDKAAMLGRDIVRAQILSQVIVQGVKVSVHRERPDQSDHFSFPSGHAASAFATAGVLHRYYGWKVGAPAYAVGSYVALARMAWNRHHATDVVMGAGFGLVSAKTVTMNFGDSKFNVGVQPQRGGASINFTKINK